MQAINFVKTAVSVRNTARVCLVLISLSAESATAEQLAALPAWCSQRMSARLVSKTNILRALHKFTGTNPSKINGFGDSPAGVPTQMRGQNKKKNTQYRNNKRFTLLSPLPAFFFQNKALTEGTNEAKLIIIKIIN